MKMYPSYPSRFSSSLASDMFRDVMCIMIICFSIGVDHVCCQHFCKVGEITSDANGEVNGANIKALLTDQQCATTSTPLPLPTTAVKPATSATPSSSVPPPVTKANSTTSPTTASSPAVTTPTPSINSSSIGPTTSAGSLPTTINSTTRSPSTKATSITTRSPSTRASSTTTPSLSTKANNSANATVPTSITTTLPATTSNESQPSVNPTSCSNKTAGNSSASIPSAPCNDSHSSPVTGSTQALGYNMSTAPGTTPGGRKRREDTAVVPTAATSPTCQIKVSPTDGQKLTTGAAWKATFSCSRDDNKCSSVNDENDSATNKTYCCTGNNCNTFPFFQQHHDIKFSTVKSCFTGSKDAVPAPCDATNTVCATVTRADGSVSYHCGTRNISRFCEPEGYEGMPQKGCYQTGKQSEGIVLVCCCGTDNCNKDQSLETSTHTDIKLVGGIIAAFLVGLLIGGVAVGCWKRKKSGSARPGELLSFNYKRMSADELQEEIDLG